MRCAPTYSVWRNHLHFLLSRWLQYALSCILIGSLVWSLLWLVHTGAGVTRKGWKRVYNGSRHSKHRSKKNRMALWNRRGCRCNGCMPVRAVCKPRSPGLKRGALATDARGCSLWRSLLERPPPAPESRVRDQLELVRTRVGGVTQALKQHLNLDWCHFNLTICSSFTTLTIYMAAIKK